MNDDRRRSAAPYPIRPVTEAEWPKFKDLDGEAFNLSAPPEVQDQFKEVLEFERTLGAFDGDLLVGFTTVFSLTMTVPGGPIPVAGVSAVSVLASHRRKGILRSLMTRQLADLHEGGESVAALYASEAGIYGRFGYGRAADTLFFRIPKLGSAFVPDVPSDPALRLRVAKPAEARGELEKVFAEVVTSRPGLYARSEGRWNGALRDSDYDRQGAGPLRCVLAEDDHGTRGYALFRVKEGWNEHDLPDGELRLKELFAVDDAAYAALWRSALDRDLCARLYAWSRPVDDPLIHLLADPRQLHAGWMDDLWVRVVNLGEAMTARRYSAPVDVVLEVSDPLCPWNEGRWRLTADAKGAAVCERTTSPADLELPVSVLGSGYLGGRPLTPLARAGAVRELRQGALKELSTAMSWEPRPWAGLIF
ncbi:GNAT family N-acetyltransferase [Thermopolyspora sp. NPDC052614]|uniref:GNAT family N-acetyltransferase n=1 Tax=Thermopolyspora sp. NPDC052614 TaxID=3155682 RepID=UPI003415E14F